MAGITAAPSAPQAQGFGSSLRKKPLAHPITSPKPTARHFSRAAMTLSHPTPLQQPTCRSHTGWDAAHVPPHTHTPPRTRWNPPAQDPPGSEARRQTPPPSGTARGQRSRGHVAPPGSPPPRGCSARREQHPALRTLPPICIRRRSRGRLTSPPGSPDSLRRVPLAARPQSAVSSLRGDAPAVTPAPVGPARCCSSLPPYLLPPSSLLRNKKSPHLPATMRSSAGRSAGFLHRDSARRWGSPNPATPPSSSPPPSHPPTAGLGAARVPPALGSGRAAGARGGQGLCGLSQPAGTSRGLFAGGAAGPFCPTAAGEGCSRWGPAGGDGLLGAACGCGGKGEASGPGRAAA